MKTQNLNELPEQMQCGKISEKQFIDQICKFVIKNYPVFGLHKYDEDFRQEVLMNLIEKKTRLIHQYNPEIGDFFTYLYCNICNIININIKKQIIQSLREKINYEECILELEEKEEKYYRIDYKTFDLPKVPFKPSTTTQPEIMQLLKDKQLKHNEKKIVILALKSSYYLTDEQILRICSFSGVNKDHLYQLIEKCKETLDEKSLRRERAEERRNFAYFHHKRYLKIMAKLDEDVLSNGKVCKNLDQMKAHMTTMEQKHRRSWSRLNDSFEKGHIYLRPTNQTVANLMGMCERQVNYYINCAKRDLEKSKIEKSDEA